jgi:hypothetical protein
MDAMAKIWVLDTDTKGTGARMVPLEEVQGKRREPVVNPVFVPPKPAPRPPAEPEARPPRRFRVVDVMSREVLAEDADVQATVRALEGVERIGDVNVHVWQPDSERWRMLGHREQRTLWDFRGRRP